MATRTAIIDVVRILNLEPKPGAMISENATSVNFKCPICGHKGYTLNVNFSKDAFKCPKCGTKGGAVALYSQVRFGEDYSPRTPRAKEITKALYGELHGEPEEQKKGPKIARALSPVIAPAADDKKDAVYRAIMTLPYFKLLPEHQANLLRRGLKEKHMNRYRSIPDMSGTKVRFNDEIAEAAKKLPVQVLPEMLFLGLKTVRDLKSLGFEDFTGIPGFFKLGSRWCLYLTPGILIPTQNEKGQIVCFQVRKDSGKLRYMTLSNKSLPGTVQDGISRCHVIKNRTQIDMENCRVYLTEGPLKADVIAALTKDPVVILAIQGINNTSCLEPVLKWLKKEKVKVIYNCLDMDRITNKNVRSGSVALRNLIQSAGFSFPSMVWDYDSALQKFEEFKELALSNGVELPEKTGNLFVSLCNLCIALEAKKIDHSKKHYWPDRSKGFDDWLLYCAKTSARQNGHPLK